MFACPSLSLTGPPISPFEQDETNYLQELGSDEEFGFEIPVTQRDLDNGEVEILEESGSDGELYPPPIPPRNHSLSPSPNMAPFQNLIGTGTADIFSEDHHRLKDANITSTSFLLEGRGGERMSPPLPMLNGIANGEEDASPPPPPLPTKSNRRRSGPKLQGIAEEEKKLMDELDLLEKLVDSRDVRRLETEAEKPEEVRGLETRTTENSVASVVSEKDSRA